MFAAIEGHVAIAEQLLRRDVQVDAQEAVSVILIFHGLRCG